LFFFDVVAAAPEEAQEEEEEEEKEEEEDNGENEPSLSTLSLPPPHPHITDMNITWSSPKDDSRPAPYAFSWSSWRQRPNSTENQYT
jgi:hypothetical protein